MAVENWSKTEPINFTEWHEPECDFMNGRDETNVPTSKLLFYKYFTDYLFKILCKLLLIVVSKLKIILFH